MPSYRARITITVGEFYTISAKPTKAERSVLSVVTARNGG